MKYFSTEHEWIDVEGDIGTVGITDFAVGQLGDVVFVELPEIGKETTKGGDAGVVESVKAASEVYSPVSGKVVAANEQLADDPALVNNAPFTDGWFFKLQLSDPSELEGLMDEAGYRAYVEGLA